MTGLKITPEGDTTIVRRTSLQPQDTTIATVLHAAGYKTCLVNKWHLDGYDPKSSPIYRGFDEFHGWLISTVESNSPYYYPYNRFDNDKLIHIKANEHDKHIKHNTDISTDDAIHFIKRNKPLELYNLREDPEEKHDLAKKYPEMVIGFDKVMKEMRTPSENWPIPEDAESRKK